MEEKQENENKKNTGIFHDDDGNFDDKRIAAWLTFVGLVFLSYQAVVNKSSEALQLVQLIIWPWMVLMGVTATEKFKPGIRQ